MVLFSVIFRVIVPAYIYHVIFNNEYTKVINRFFTEKYRVSFFNIIFTEKAVPKIFAQLVLKLTNIPMGNDKLELHVANHNTCLTLTNIDKIFIGTVIICVVHILLIGYLNLTIKNRFNSKSVL